MNMSIEWILRTHYDTIMSSPSSSDSADGIEISSALSAVKVNSARLILRCWTLDITIKSSTVISSIKLSIGHSFQRTILVATDRSLEASLSLTPGG